MKHLLIRLAAAMVTFLVGLCAATLFIGRPHQRAAAPPPAERVAAVGVLTSYPPGAGCATTWDKLSIPDEQKAVFLAQDFIAMNGYTDAPPYKDALAYEPIEWTDDLQELLRARHNTLEPLAYGVSHFRRNGDYGWTVVFKYTKRMGVTPGTTGRAVTMDEDFHNLRVEHEDFFLNKVEKKLSASR